MRYFAPLLSVIGAVALTATHSSAAIAFSPEFDILADKDGNPLSAAGSTGYYVLVSDNLGDGITNPTLGVSTAPGTYMNGVDDYVLFSSDLTLNGIDGFDANFTGGLTVAGDPAGTWGTGDPLYLLWFPDTAEGAVPAPGAEYGIYTDPVGAGGTNPWITPGDPAANYPLTAITDATNFGFSNIAPGSLNAIPEPSGAVLMLGSILFAAFRRRRR